MYPPFIKYLVPPSITQAFFSIPSVVLLGVFKELSLVTTSPFLDKEALINSLYSKSLSKKLISSYITFISYGFIKYWSDNDKPKALSSSSVGAFTFNLCKSKSNLSLHEGIPLLLNQLERLLTKSVSFKSFSL